MARLEILEYPDPNLRLTSEPVTRFDKNLERLVNDLAETLDANSIIGLSSPQVNVPQRVAVTNPSGGASEPQVYVNPVIISKSTWGIVEESCASIPDVVGNVIRATKVHVRAQDRHGDAFERVLTDMDAVCIQHEIDHLNGKLFIDRLSFFRKLALRSRLRAKVRRHNNAA